MQVCLHGTVFVTCHAYSAACWNTVQVQTVKGFRSLMDTLGAELVPADSKDPELCAAVHAAEERDIHVYLRADDTSFSQSLGAFLAEAASGLAGHSGTPICYTLLMLCKSSGHRTDTAPPISSLCHVCLPLLHIMVCLASGKLHDIAWCSDSGKLPLKAQDSTAPCGGVMATYVSVSLL